MCPLNKIIFLLIPLLSSFGCKENEDRINDLSMGCDIPCSENLDCIDDKCVCPEGHYSDYKVPFTSDSESHVCTPINDSIYIRVGYEGNIDIENFEMYDLLFVPINHNDFDGLLAPSWRSYDKPFPEQFLVRLFSSDYHEQADFYPYYPIVFENLEPDNTELPMQGETFVEPVMDTEGFGEGRWFLELSEEEAKLQFDLYRPDSTGYHVKVDELILFYERYEK